MLVRCNDNFVVKSNKIYTFPMLPKYIMPPKKYQKEAAARVRKAMLPVHSTKYKSHPCIPDSVAAALND